MFEVTKKILIEYHTDTYTLVRLYITNKYLMPQ